MKKDFIAIKDLSLKDIEEIFSLTDKLKKDKAGFSKVLEGKTLALVFQKPSNRTRVSFEVGMFQLGGHSIYLGFGEINLGVRESIKDVAKTLSRYVDGIVLRTFEHKNVLEMAKFSTVPVINGLSDLLHPCQALADVYTIREKLFRKSGIPKKAGKNIKGVTLAYIGDGNNVCNSLLHACAKIGINMNVAQPKGYEADSSVLKEAKAMAKTNKVSINTDVWTSMGQEKEARMRKKIFRPFQVNKNLVKLARKKALIMHCLPAHRGDEITDEVMDSQNSIVFDQAENRMHVQKAILIKLLCNV
jgi:ornithine carbamoyltransferase